jgi:hypothetical protein
VPRRTALAAALDIASIVVFVAIGRREHDGDSAGIASTAAPFLIGLVIAWWAARAWKRPESILTGVTIWPVTVLVGMVARRLLFDDGTAPAFVVVATLFIGLCLVGWRVVARTVRS